MCLLITLVSHQLKNAVHESSCAMTLNCIASNFTSCFLASSTPDLDHCKHRPVVMFVFIINIATLAFLTWIITRILRLLASEECSPLHPKALECLSNILHVCYACVYACAHVCVFVYLYNVWLTLAAKACKL